MKYGYLSYMTKILFLIQISNELFIDRVFNKILKYNTNNNFYCISVLKSIVIDMNKYNLINYHLLYHDNIGMDIGPYLLQLKWLLTHNITYTHVYKIHTKTNEKWFDELTNIEITNNDIEINNKWKCKLDSRNKYHINKICTDFNIPNIYYDVIMDISYNINDIDKNFYSSYYDVTLHNNSEINSMINCDFDKQYILQDAINNEHVLNESQIIVKRRHNIIFCGGSIFIIKFNLLYNFAKTIDIDKLYLLLEKNYTINNVSTYVHALERIISSFFL